MSTIVPNQMTATENCPSYGNTEYESLLKY